MVFLAADNQGFYLKEEIKKWCLGWGLQIEDLGCLSVDKKADIKDLSGKLAKKVASHYDDAVGIIVSDTGIGASIFCNRFKRIRCGLTSVADQVRSARQENDLNVLALAAKYTSFKRAQKIVSEFFKTEFRSESVATKGV